MLVIGPHRVGAYFRVGRRGRRCGVAQRSMPQWGIEPHEWASFAGWRPSFWPPNGPALGRRQFAVVEKRPPCVKGAPAKRVGDCDLAYQSTCPAYAPISPSRLPPCHPLTRRAPLSLRDISPHCGESPFSQGRLLFPPCFGAGFVYSPKFSKKQKVRIN